MWRFILKSGSLKLLETPGPVQACIGIALLLRSRTRSLRSPCINKWGSDEEQLASSVGLQSTLSPSWCSWPSSESKLSSLKAWLKALIQASRGCLGQHSLQLTNRDISLCIWIWRWSLLRLLNKCNNRMRGRLVPPKPWERRTTFGANYFLMLWEASHTLHIKYEGAQLLTWLPSLYPK